ncbi:hypothetical protein [Acetivibrio mesophilus]|mgnify:CR=1 FL=1|uniref:Uncharacterized protein n=1 Tax=Acetivibrio mesophilus TaxID=2487273 RepID=A0A4Q0I035_9FIRM|nr:hypothetical protein [Acetivibrio mesophilus]RXE57556.1 hypothetical protein EFD62_17080 [Acetivibrio mesophilus]
MRLVGSKTEEDFRDSLIKSHNLLFNKNSYRGLVQVLKTSFPEMKTAYIIRHIPEQGEDLYTILVDLDTIATIEISRYSQDEKPIIEISSINDFKHGMSKVEQIKLAVALDLAKKDIL